MNTSIDRHVTNAVVLGTILETAKAVVKNLDGHGINIYGENRDVSDTLLDRLIIARINNNLQSGVKNANH